MYLLPVLGSVLLLGESYYFKSVQLVNCFCHLPVVRMTYQAVYLTGMTRRLHYRLLPCRVDGSY